MEEKITLKELDPVLREIIQQNGAFRLYAKGTSMQPFIRSEKDSVLLGKPAFPLKKYDIILYQRKNGQYVLHRIIDVQAKSYTLRGDNQTVTEPGVMQDQIIAVVKGIYRKQRYWPQTNAFIILGGVIWNSTLFFRSVLHIVRRVLSL